MSDYTICGQGIVKKAVILVIILQLSLYLEKLVKDI